MPREPGRRPGWPVLRKPRAPVAPNTVSLLDSVSLTAAVTDALLATPAVEPAPGAEDLLGGVRPVQAAQPETTGRPVEPGRATPGHPGRRRASRTVLATTFFTAWQ